MSVQILSGGELVYEPWPIAGDWHMFSGNVEDYQHPRHSLLDPDYVWRTQRHLRTVVGYLARNFAQVRLIPYRRDTDGNRERLERDSRLAYTLRHPDVNVIEYDFALHRMIDMCLWDRWLALKLFDPDGRVRLRRIPPRRWRFLRDDEDIPVGVRVRPKNPKPGTDPYVDIALEFAVWVDGYPVKGPNSWTPMEFLVDLMTEEAESAKYRIDMWRNGARISGVIERPMEAPKWEKPARDAFGRRWRAAYTRGGSGSYMGGTPVLEDGMVFKQMKAITPEQAEQIESRKLSLAEVAAAFFVAPELIGAREGTYSNIKAYREGLYNETLGPVFSQSQQVFDARLVPDFEEEQGDIFVEHNVADKLKMAFEEQAGVLQTLTGGPVMTRQEGRRRLNLRDLDQEGVDELIVPLNVLVGGQASPTDSRPDLRALPDPSERKSS